MAAALYHRGPDEDGFLEEAGIALASRRLSIVGLKDGRQPIANEDQSVWVVYNGENFDYLEIKAALEAKGHHFRTSTDTELLPHLWEEYGEGMFEHVRGQFAFALWDQRQNRLILARDRFGICPLFYTVRRDGDGWWLLFASEVKGLLASGLVEAKPDRRRLIARQVGSEAVVVPFGGPEVTASYPELIHTAEAPVIDTACAALMELAKSVHAHGFKVALTGEGSDEYLAGYPWFKLHRVLSVLDVVPGLSQYARRGALRVAGLPRFPWSIVRRNAAAVGGYN